ncbi:MAG TPA: type II secretion system F family protein [Opitutaceae bacterium]|mgnify:CR=1 FL=1|nr:type II secretion system F family protein [Opitutaceae bacterium]
MPRYHYQAIEVATGRQRAGVMDGPQAEAVMNALKARGLAPTKLELQADAAKPAVKRSRFTLTLGRPVSPQQLAVFTRQLAMLTRAGVPLVRALEILGRQERNPAFRPVLEDLIEGIRGGGTFSDGLRRHPRIFDRLYVNMVRAGESGGVLEAVLARLAQFLEQGVQVRGRLKAAMTYPAIIVVVASAIVLGLITFVVPRFEAIFAGTLKGQALPALTQFVLGVSRLLKEQTLLVGGFAVGVWLLIGLAARTEPGGRWLDRWKLRVPLLGEVLLKAAVARFARTFGTLLASGVPMLQALAIARDTAGNTHIAAAIQAVHDRVKEGDGIAGPLRATRIFPDMAPSMIEVGEETGALPEMLGRVADSYDEEVDRTVAALTTLIEPLMIVLMAVMVGTIVIALFLPIIRIVQSLG